MDQGVATSKYVRISPTKARRAAGLIRGKSVIEAKQQLGFYGLKGAHLLLKTVDSAVANAESLFGFRKEELHILEVRVDDGPRLKRSKPKNRGGKVPILKRTSHFKVVVGSAGEV